MRFVVTGGQFNLTPAVYPILDSLVVRIPACHAGGRGSIPRQGETFFLAKIGEMFSNFYEVSQNVIEQSRVTGQSPVQTIKKSQQRSNKYTFTKCLLVMCLIGTDKSL